MVILPHWNSTAADYERLGTWLRRLGLTAVQVSLPYHDERASPGASGASGLVSANLGQTIRSCQQAVADARAVVGWLWERGYRRIGVLGVSIGSCLGCLVAAHDQRVGALAQVLAASDFGEVVWTGRATLHIRQALEGAVSLEQVNAAAKQVVDPAKATWIVVGDRAKVEQGIRDANVAEVIVIDADGQPVGPRS